MRIRNIRGFYRTPDKPSIMIELKPDEKYNHHDRSSQIPEKNDTETVRPPAIDDLRFFVKGSLTLLAKFVHDIDWLLTKIKSNDKS